MSGQRIETVLKNHAERIMSLPEVAGTGIGLCDGVPCIKIFVTKLTEEVRKKVPDQIEGHPVRIEETGEFRAYQ